MVIPVFERFGDDLGLCRARRLEALIYWNEARAEAAGEAWDARPRTLALAGDRHLYNEILTWIASSLWFGPTPASEGIRRCEAMREEVRESPESEAAILRHLGGLHAIVGRFDACPTVARNEQRRLRRPRAHAQRGDLRERSRRRAARREPGCCREERCATDIARSRRWASAPSARRWPRPSGVAILEQGRDEEAEDFAKLSAQLAANSDLLTQILWRGVRARVLARRAAVRGGRGARSRGRCASPKRPTSLTTGRTHWSTYRRCSRPPADATRLSPPRPKRCSLYELKGNMVAAAATQLRLATLAKM